MARSWQYSRYRRVIMQGVMWVVLGVTMGLAALQTRHHPTPVQHSSAMNVYKLGPWRVRVPEDWVRTERPGKILDFHELASPDDPAAQEFGGRELEVAPDVVDSRQTSADFLADKLRLASLPNAKLILMGGQQGVIIAIPELIGEGQEPGTSIYASVVMPKGDAIIVLLRVPRKLTPADIVLAENIAGTIMYQPTDSKGTPRSDLRKPQTRENSDDAD